MNENIIILIILLSQFIIAALIFTSPTKTNKPVMSYKCSIPADSENTFGSRLTTFLVTFPRFVLAELNTHRMFSRNSASSRAIPFKKNKKAVKSNPFIPLQWMKDHSGMQGTHYITKPFPAWLLRNLWLLGMHLAVFIATMLNKVGLSKQICNRIIEPWMWHTALITASEYENFFALRANEQAEIHIQKLAYMMMEAYNTSTPRQLNEGEWHIPFVDNIDPKKLKAIVYGSEFLHDDTYKNASWLDFVVMVSTAMCARTSYVVVGEEDKPQNYLNDIKLHARLASSGHWSPFEHIAKPMNNEEWFSFSRTVLLTIEDSVEWVKGGTGRKLMRLVINSENNVTGIEPGWCGNFQGFVQYRKFFKNENAKDSRVIRNKVKLEM